MDEMFFPVSFNSDPQNTTTPQDEILDYVPIAGSNTNMGSRGQQPKLLASGQRENCNNDEDKKKSLHRDIERQRRQEMATLYASLRTLLPLEYIKVNSYIFNLSFFLGGVQLFRLLFKLE